MPEEIIFVFSTVNIILSDITAFEQAHCLLAKHVDSVTVDL